MTRICSTSKKLYYCIVKNNDYNIYTKAKKYTIINVQNLQPLVAEYKL